MGSTVLKKKKKVGFFVLCFFSLGNEEISYFGTGNSNLVEGLH